LSSGFSSLRKGLIVFFALLLLVSAFFLFYSETVNETSTFQTQTTLCARNIAIRIAPSQTEVSSCSISQNEWLTFSLISTQSVPVVATILLNSSVGLFLIFNQSNTAFSGVFPIGQNGSIVARIYNPTSKFAPVTGLVTVYAETQVQTTIPTIVFPFRLLGYGLITVSFIALFMLVWNPNRITSNALEKITLAWNRRQERKKARAQKTAKYSEAEATSQN
jgi:hypothetical protein